MLENFGLILGLDPRKNTFIGILFPTFPVFEQINFTFTYGQKAKVKFWDLFIFACCELLTTTTTVLGVSIIIALIFKNACCFSSLEVSFFSNET